jgi:hypothetical protein
MENPLRDRFDNIGVVGVANPSFDRFYFTSTRVWARSFASSPGFNP